MSEILQDHLTHASRRPLTPLGYATRSGHAVRDLTSSRPSLTLMLVVTQRGRQTYRSVRAASLVPSPPASNHARTFRGMSPRKYQRISPLWYRSGSIRWKIAFSLLRYRGFWRCKESGANSSPKSRLQGRIQGILQRTTFSDLIAERRSAKAVYDSFLS
jgi:hypothetical protein